MENTCLLSGSVSVEGAHVVNKGPSCETFKSVYSRIYPFSEYLDGIENAQNIVYLREDYHRGPMDNLGLPINLRSRRLGFDFINRASYIISLETGKIEKFEWFYVPDVKKEYFAWSNNDCMKRLRKHLRKIDRRLIDYSVWVRD